jgi:uncharacterized repeat protein (TIGR01451 family)
MQAIAICGNRGEVDMRMRYHPAGERSGRNEIGSLFTALGMAGLLLTLLLAIPTAAARPDSITDPLAPRQGISSGLLHGDPPPPREGTTLLLTTTTELSRPLPLWPRVTVSATGTKDMATPSLDWIAALQEGSPVPIAQTTVERIYLGDVLNYSLAITNNSEHTATATVQDVLPAKTLDSDVECQPACARDVEVITVTIQTPTQFGAPPYTRMVTMTHRVEWEGIPLAQGESAHFSFSIRVTGQPDGTTLRNRAYIRYQLGNGDIGTAMSNETTTAVEVYVAPGAGTSVSSLPTWYSEDLGGTASLDWGDYDGDGYLDLVVGGSTGTTVYHNEQGQLVKLWSSKLFTHHVHWADIDGTATGGNLELIAVGYDWWTEEVSNHIYRLHPDGGRFVDIGTTSFLNHRLLQVEPADYDGDGDLDLIAVVYRTWTPDNCTFRVYSNDGGRFISPPRCIANPYQDYGKLTENLLSLGDYDNDDDLDLVADLYETDNPGGPCPYRDMLYLMTNDGGVFTTTTPIAIDTFTQCAWPMDTTWGDYDRDGDLDLAAAIPVLSGPASQQVRIYRNQTAEGTGPGFTTAYILDLPIQFPAFAVQWGDLDVDGDLDLAVAGSDSAFRVYLNTQSSFAPNRFLASPEGAVNTFALDLAGADYDNDGDLDLAVGNPLGPNALFHTFASRLSAGLSQIAAWSAGSVAWGDADRDGNLDLLFGASESTVNARLYYNVDGGFPDYMPFSSSGFGPQSTALGDMDGDGALDIALGTPVEIQVYFQGNRDTPDWPSPPYLAANNLAWGDADDDGDLDLAASVDGPDPYFVNEGGMLAATPAWSTGKADDTRSLAWADYNDDRYLDLAVGNSGQPNHIYRNDGDNTFSLVWSAPQAYATTSVAWADYDGDGDSDLAVGNYGQPNLIYENVNGSFGPDPVWVSAEISQTTSLAWGDWDNDGDLDLAVGNRNQRNQVYLNQHSRPGLPRLIWLWSSDQAYPTTGIAWGDRDGDGDLDLAISSESRIGIHNNNYVIPSHLTELFTPTMLLPNSPSYVAVKRPGITDHAYFYSSADILSGPMQPTITVQYKLFDPDGTRQAPGSNEPGDIITSTLFEFSPDGGATWQPATPSDSDPVSTTYRLGQEAVFVWDAVADAAISDNARFRVSVIPYNPVGPVQRAMTSAISPPFRVRGTSCIWPRDPAIAVSDPNPDPGESVSLEGSVAEASGILTFTWDFGDGSTAVGQVVEHAYGSDGTYAVRLTVRSEPCPTYKEVFANLSIPVGSGVPNVFLPVVVKNW